MKGIAKSTATWAVLVALTVLVTWGVELTGASAWVVAMVALTVAAVKACLVGMEYLELGRAPRPVLVVGVVWIVAVTLAVGALYMVL